MARTTAKLLKEAEFQLAFVKSKVEKLQQLIDKKHLALHIEIDAILKEL